MSVVKVVEVLSDSRVSWEHAAQQAVAIAAKTLNNVKYVHIKDYSATVENGKIISYRVNAKVSTALE